MAERRLDPLPVLRDIAPAADMTAAEEDVCALCGRPGGGRMEKHHLVPRLKGGRETVPLHPICHRKLHSLFTESELATAYNTIEALQAHPDVAAFISWVRKRPAGFHKRTRTAQRNGQRNGKGNSRGRGQT
ncbi:HNH endonuclease signature motif containing protein [Pyruvatibacter mobilis]|uniref:HNH endonuclease signature motif containing protein n=1 Tax=Pyruvatibacter mobilis TaxID=1712261 RepID=UPI003BAD794B